MKTELEKTIIELWHISRTALAGMPTVPTRHDRMSYIKRTLKEQYPALIASFKFDKHIWFEIEDTIRVF